jgi:hypothetical protein
MNISTAHPRLVILGIGLAITFEIGIIAGTFDSQHALAASNSNAQT